MRILLGLLYVVIMTEGRADIFHYNNILPGVRSAHLGGAYTALSDDPSGIAYNPAGMAFVRDDELSGSVQGYYRNSETYQNAIGDQNFVENSGGGFAPYLGSLFNSETYFPNAVAGFSLYTTDSLNQEQNTLIKDQPFGNLTISRYYRTLHATSETSVKAGALAKRWGDVALGLSLGLLTVNELYQSYQNSAIRENRSGTTVTNIHVESVFRKISLTGMEPILGVLFKPTEHFAIGLALRQAIIISEDFAADLDSTEVVVDDQDDVVSARDGRRGIQRTVLSIASKRRVKNWPFGARLGLASHMSPRATLAFDVDYRGKASAESEEFDRQAVTNLHFGGEYRATSQLVLRSGFFTNKDSRSPLSADKSDQVDHVDYWGISAFAEYAFDSSRYSAGAIYQRGRGESQKVQSSDRSPAPLQDVHGQRLALVIGISHTLNESTCPSG